MEDTNPYATAIHEAGHAVIGTLVGLNVTHLTVVPADGNLGMVTYENEYVPEVRQILDDQDFTMEANMAIYYPDEIEVARRDLAKHAMFSAAGPNAEMRHTGAWDNDGAKSDNERIELLLRVFYFDFIDFSDESEDHAPALQAAVSYYDGPTIEEYLDNPLVWSWIEKVADTAYARGEMTGDEIRALRPAGLT